MRRLTALFLLIMAPFVLHAQWQKTTLTDNAGKITGFAIVGSKILASMAALTSTQTGGVYASTDGGSSWQLSNGGNSNKTVTSITLLGSSLYVGTDGDGVLVSTDNGANWATTNTGLTNLKVNKVMASGTNLYAGTGGGLFVSSDNGANWTTLTSSLSNQYITCFIATPSSIVLTNQGYPLYNYSSDGGASWNDAMSGLPLASSACYALAGTDILNGTGSGVYLSSNNGASWRSLGLSGSIYSLAALGNNFLCGPGPLRGLSISTNRGTTWTAASDGIDQLNSTINAICFVGGDVLLGSTNSAIFKRSLGSLGITTDVETSGQAPMTFALRQNYPNPFNPSTTIDYSLGVRSLVSVRIFDVLGREVATLVNEERPAGTHQVRWNAAGMPSGVYFCKLQAGAFTSVKRMLLMK